MQIDLDDTVYSFHLSEINIYAWMINRNLHNYILEELLIFKENEYTTKKTKNKNRM